MNCYTNVNTLTFSPVQLDRSHYLNCTFKYPTFFKLKKKIVCHYCNKFCGYFVCFVFFLNLQHFFLFLFN